MINHYVVTGSNGYLGSQFVRAALQKGHKVIALSRRRDSELHDMSELEVLDWNLGETVSNAIDLNNKILVHFCHDWSDTFTGEDSVNLIGTMRLAKDALARGCKKFIFISTTAAHSQSLNKYGITKRAIELSLREIKTEKIAIIKVGMVYGGNLNGLYGNLVRIASEFPILPVVGKNILLQPIHIDDLIYGINKVANLKTLSAEDFVLASSDPITFGNYLSLIRRSRNGRGMIMISVPFWVMLSISKILDTMPFGLKVSRERLYGLIQARVIPSESTMQNLSMNLRENILGILNVTPLRRRCLLKEALLYLRYFNYSGSMMSSRPFLRSLEISGQSIPIYLLRYILNFSLLIYLLDSYPRDEKNPFTLRLMMAARYKNHLEPTTTQSIFWITFIIIAEITLYPLRMLSRKLLKWLI